MQDLALPVDQGQKILIRALKEAVAEPYEQAVQYMRIDNTRAALGAMQATLQVRMRGGVNSAEETSARASMRLYIACVCVYADELTPFFKLRVDALSSSSGSTPLPLPSLSFRLTFILP